MEDGREGATDAVSRTRNRHSRRATAVVVATVAIVALLAVGAYAWGAAEQDSTETANRAPTDSSAPAPSSTTASTTTVVPTAAPATVSTTAPPTTTTTVPEPPPSQPTIQAPKATSGYSFPIVPSSAASYARSHHDYPAADIFAPCGSDVVAPHAGVVQDVTYEDVWSSGVDTAESRGGLSFSVVGDDGVRYYGSHLRELDPATRPGVKVDTGQRLGAVGDTGNAAGTGCHLHFGISTPCGPGDVLRRRGEFWPQEFLDSWRSSEPASPAAKTAPSKC